MKKIAIIGANSYIARNVILYLKLHYTEYKLYLYDCGEVQLDGEPNYYQIDILDSNSVKKIDFSCEYIYMFIGKTGTTAGFEDYNTFIDINEKALLNVLNEYIHSNSLAKIIFPSTRLLYKGKEEMLSEDDEKEFKTIYAINKYSCENYLKLYNLIYNVQYLTFRICVPYGSLIANASSYGTAGFMLGKAVKGENIILYGDGNVRRTLTYMEDLCKVLVEGGLSEVLVNDTYNIGGEDYSLKEMAQIIADKYNISIDFVEYPKIAELIESGSTVFNDSKMQSIYPVEYKGNFKKWCLQLK